MKTTKKTPFLVLSLSGALALGAAATAAATATQAAAGDQGVPRPDGPIDQPTLDLNPLERAVVVRVDLTDPAAESTVRVVKQRAYTHENDRGPIAVELLDDERQPIDAYRAAAPEEDRRGEIVSRPGARFAVPYDPDLAVVHLTDTRDGRELRVDVQRAIADFCAANPTDVGCRPADLGTGAEFLTDGWGVVGTTPAVTVGVPTDVSVSAWSTRQGTATPAYTASLTTVVPFAEGLTVTTADPTTFGAGRHDDVARSEATLTYTVACTVPGPYRFWVWSQVGGHGAAYVETNPGDEQWGIWTDVDCLAA